MAKNTPKKVVKKIPKAPAVKLVSFTVTAIIPTEPYGNIQPAITVQAANIEDAKNIVLPHIDALMAKYSMNAPKITNGAPGTNAPEAPKAEEKAPEKPVSESFKKALNAIKTAYSITALDMIDDQVIFSKKLTDSEKITLKPFVEEKRKELSSK